MTDPETAESADLAAEIGEETWPKVVIVLKRSWLPRKQPWRWIAKSAGNNRRLATSGEWYTNRKDAIKAIYILFGENSHAVLREVGIGDVTLRVPGWRR